MPLLPVCLPGHERCQVSKPTLMTPSNHHRCVQMKIDQYIFILHTP